MRRFLIPRPDVGWFTVLFRLSQQPCQLVSIKAKAASKAILKTVPMPQPTLEEALIRSQVKPGPVLRADLTGKTVIVIGANTGLGFETAKHLATMNPSRLILACRSKEKGEAALQSKEFSSDLFGT